MAIKHRSERELDITTNLQILSGYRRLAASVVKNAVQEIKSGDPQTKQAAENWMQTDGVEWLAMLGISEPGAGVERLLDPPGKLVISIFRQEVTL